MLCFNLNNESKLNKMNINENDHVQGLTDAPIELIEYGDFQCPYCRKADVIVKGFQRELGDSIKFVFRNFPLTELHPNALHAALAAEAAALQDKFWDMHDILFENQKFLDDENLIRYAKIIGLDEKKFEKDFSKNEVIQKVKEDYNSGEKNGVEGTPTFFVNGRIYQGNWMGQEFVDYLISLSEKYKK